MARGMKVETLTISRQINKTPNYSLRADAGDSGLFPDVVVTARHNSALGDA